MNEKNRVNNTNLDIFQNCSFHSWYPNFTNVASKAFILPIPPEVIKYLEQDAFILPTEALPMTNSISPWSDETLPEDVIDLTDQPTFPNFSRKIQEIITEIGAVFIKCNWSSPLDASWITSTKTLKCSCLEDVYLLLKSSDKISKDFNLLRHLERKGLPFNPCLILKKWKEIDQHSEFRCFVKNKTLVGISQRDITQHYSCIEKEQFEIKKNIQEFYENHIQLKFLMDNYTFDIVRYQKHKLKIIDFGPLNEDYVKMSLFTLNDLNEIDETPQYRFICKDLGIQPNHQRYCCIPKELEEFFQSNKSRSIIDILQEEIESKKDEN